MANDSHLLNIHKCSASSFPHPSTEPMKFPIALQNKKTISPRSSYLVSLLASMQDNIQEKEVNADSILEEHLSRIWEDSSNVAISDKISTPKTQHSVSRYSISPQSIVTSKFFPAVSSKEINKCTASSLPVHRITFQRTGIDIPCKLAAEEFSTKTKMNKTERLTGHDTSDLIRCSWCDSVEDLSCGSDQGGVSTYGSQSHAVTTSQQRHTNNYTPLPHSNRHLKTFSFLIGNTKLDTPVSNTPHTPKNIPTNFTPTPVRFEQTPQKSSSFSSAAASFTQTSSASLSLPPSCISVSSPRTIARHLEGIYNLRTCDMCTCGASPSSSSSSIPVSKSQLGPPVPTHENNRTDLAKVMEHALWMAN